MIWQDVVFAVGNIGLSVSLLPSLFSSHKPHKRTCAWTALFLCSFTVAFSTLGLWFSAAAVLTSAALWGILLVQRRTA